MLSDLWLIEQTQAVAQEARAAAEEAIGISRQMARQYPAVFRPVLAQALLILGAAQAELGQQEETEATADEAVQIVRILAQENRAKYQHPLALTLTCQRLAGEEPGEGELALAQALLVRVFRLESGAEDFSATAVETAEAVRLLMPPDRRGRLAVPASKD